MSVFRTLLVITRALAMALWVGAMAGFAFIVAPIAFHSMGPTPAFAAMIAEMLRTLTLFGALLASVAIAATIFLGVRNRDALLFAGMVLTMWLLTLYERSAIIPQMERTALQTPAYEALHRASSEVYGLVLLLGVAAIALLSVRDVGKR